MSPAAAASPTRAVIAAASGSVLEWFDLLLYAFFAPQIAHAIFPSSDPTSSLLATFGAFAVSYVVRPLGGLVLGIYADRAGRKAALTLSMALMMAGTFLMVVTPPQSQVGVLAPVMVVVARLLQGFSTGGEFSSATAFLAEQAPERHAFYSSWQFASSALAVLLGGTVAALLTSELTAEQLASWGWRVGFVLGLAIGPVALYIRRHIDESPEFRSAGHSERPLREVLDTQKRAVLLAFGATILATVAMYTVLYMPTYALTQLELPAPAGLTSLCCAAAVLTIVIPVAGLLTDRVGPLRVAIPAATTLVAAPAILFSWVARHPTAVALTTLLAILSVPVGAYLGALPALLTDLFPIQLRGTAISLSYNLTVMSFGALTPLAIMWAIRMSASPAAAGYYFSLCALVSVAALLIVNQRRGDRATTAAIAA